MQSITVSTNIS